MADTGNGAAVTFTTLATAFGITGINIDPETLEKLKSSLLSTEGKHTYIPADLSEPMEVELTIQWDTLDDPPTLGGTPDTMTITFPLATGESVAANLAGTGFFIEVGYPELVNDTIQEATVKFAFDGYTGPTYTKATAAA